MVRFAVALAAVFALAAAAAHAQSKDQKSLEWKDAAETPLRDLNVMPQRIPSVLLDAEADAYRAPSPWGCRTIESEVRRLEDALGEDFDAPPPPPPTRNEKRTGTANMVLKGAA